MENEYKEILKDGISRVNEIDELIKIRESTIKHLEDDWFDDHLQKLLEPEPISDHYGIWQIGGTYISKDGKALIVVKEVTRGNIRVSFPGLDGFEIDVSPRELNQKFDKADPQDVVKWRQRHQHSKK